ncbi:unnamed protein product [Spirodela intermedia]|uniref:Mon2/Sec7/BIG1-like dimerisation and cyclophilin-binding domain-containing protein n=1 Tax=Spirodela intermedia TaxID=51605 RepID=A0A7I8L1V5_SPIIN|nr:unnamed protein product [Spirodela intermedia]
MIQLFRSSDRSTPENLVAAAVAAARRRHPAVKDAAEHAILKLRSSSSPNEIAQNDIVRIFLMACDVKSVKLSVIGLSCIQKLLSNDAVITSSLKDIISTLKDYMYNDKDRISNRLPHEEADMWGTFSSLSTSVTTLDRTRWAETKKVIETQYQ